jgi:hypothetical protein
MPDCIRSVSGVHTHPSVDNFDPPIPRHAEEAFRPFLHRIASAGSLPVGEPALAAPPRSDREEPVTWLPEASARWPGTNATGVRHTLLLTPTQP